MHLPKKRLRYENLMCALIDGSAKIRLILRWPLLCVSRGVFPTRVCAFMGPRMRCVCARMFFSIVLLKWKGAVQFSGEDQISALTCPAAADAKPCLSIHRKRTRRAAVSEFAIHSAHTRTPSSEQRSHTQRRVSNSAFRRKTHEWICTNEFQLPLVVQWSLGKFWQIFVLI